MDKKQIAEEEVKRALLLMKYDSRKTLTENVQDTEEVNEWFGAVAAAGRALIPWLTRTAASVGTAVTTRLGPGAGKFIAQQGAFAGLALWLDNAMTSGGDSFKKTKAFFEGCAANAKELKPTLDKSKHRAAADKIYNAIEGVGTKLPDIKSAFSEMTTVADICAMQKYYNNTYGDLYDDLDSDVDGEDFRKYVWAAISPQVADAQEDLEKVKTDPDKKEDNKKTTSGGGGGGGTGGGWKSCSGTYSRGCSGEKIREVQGCLGGLVPDGKFGPKTEAAVKAKLGTTTFTDADVAKLCGKTEVSTDDDEVVDAEDPNKL